MVVSMYFMPAAYGDGEGVFDGDGAGELQAPGSGAFNGNGVGPVASSGAVHSEPSAKRTARMEQLLPVGASRRQLITVPGEKVPIFAKSVPPIRSITSFAV